MKHIFKERTKEKRKVITSGVGGGSARQTICANNNLQLSLINNY